MSATISSANHLLLKLPHARCGFMNCISCSRNASFHASPTAMQLFAVSQKIGQDKIHQYRLNALLSNEKGASSVNSRICLNPSVDSITWVQFSPLSFHSFRSPESRSLKSSKRLIQGVRASSEAASNYGRPHIGDEVKESKEAVKVKPKGILENVKLKNRVIFGIIIGIAVFFCIVFGGWFFTLWMSVAVMLGSKEFFGLVSARAKAKNEKQPHPLSSTVCILACSLMPFITLYNGGEIFSSLVIASTSVLISLLLQSTRPRLNDIKSLILGIFYCGYLPSFWIKIRCGLSLPALEPGVLMSSSLAQAWPQIFGGQSNYTYGLVLTFLSFSTIIAADTGAYLGDISPKKTMEGALFGLLASIITTIALSKLFQWPSSILSACAFSVVVFAASLFGDLVESYMKRDAGVKDSGDLIPGHGGLLDRADSYIITGAVVFAFLKFILPIIGA